MQFDLRTLYFTFALTSLANIAVMTYLWLANRKRFKGIGYLVLDFIFQFISMNLIFMRDKISDYLSISLGTAISVTGIMFSLFGLQLLNNIRPKWQYNGLILGIYFLITIHFVSDGATVELRNLSYALFSNIYLGQIIYLFIFQLNKKFLSESKPILYIIVAFFVLNIVRIVTNGLSNDASTDYFTMGGIESYVFILYNVFFAMLTFAVVLAINNKLLQTVKTEEEMFIKIFHCSPFGILVTKFNNGQIIDVNHGFERISGYQHNECVGKTTLELKIWQTATERAVFIDKLNQEQGNLISLEFQFKRKNNSIFNGIINSTVFDFNDEKHVLSIIEDISDLKSMLNELKITSDKLAKLNAAKDKFFSIIAHDLRAPFTQVNALAELIKADVVDKQYTEVDKEADLILKSSQKAMGLLMNLLEWSRIQSGRMAFNPENINLYEAINNNMLLLEQTYKNKQISVEFSGNQNTFCTVDKNMFDSIIRNLLSNAIKFTNAGGNINIALNELNQSIQICVTDNGIGISPERAEKLFSIDGNQSTPGTQNEAGTGLGLVLCKEFVEKHGGTIWVNSIPGKGSSFCFSIPRKVEG